jgi:hypothetical protein
MLLTAHWSATSNQRIRDYHVEYAAISAVPQTLIDECYNATDASQIDWASLVKYFVVWKNFDFETATSYGTYLLNHDPNGSPNIELGALCMGGEGVGTSSFGKWPYTAAHFAMHAGIAARVALLKGVNPSEAFDDGALQNGPFYRLSTHGERAIQTPDGPDATLRPSFGYFIYSGDPDSRWDIAVKDPRDIAQLRTPDGAFAIARTTAHQLRALTDSIVAGGVSDYWNLDKDPT